MKRDILVIALGNEEVVIASDNSGAIGLKTGDSVKVPDEMVSYFGFRVAVMECMAAGGKPAAVIIHNFTGNEAWDSYVKGIRKAAAELGEEQLPITGSTESNFIMLQSAMGIVVLGKRESGWQERPLDRKSVRFAVVGKPLVGNEVIAQREAVLPLSLFKTILDTNGVLAALPVGSKGILHELRLMTGMADLQERTVTCELDVTKTSGPATCLLIGIDEEKEEEIKRIAGELYHPLAVHLF
ncbi:MAG TPA: hypothetical protein VEY51_20595 [Chondromyces sp.]|nr:hypothetical protein [Chondromyces sp.]